MGKGRGGEICGEGESGTEQMNETQFIQIHQLLLLLSLVFFSFLFFFSFFFSLFIFGCLFTFSPRIISAKKEEPENILVCREHISGVSKIGFDVLFRTVLKQYQSLSH